MHGIDTSMYGKGFIYCICGFKNIMTAKVEKHIRDEKKRKKRGS